MIFALAAIVDFATFPPVYSSSLRDALYANCENVHTMTMTGAINRVLLVPFQDVSQPAAAHARR